MRSQILAILSFSFAADASQITAATPVEAVAPPSTQHATPAFPTITEAPEHVHELKRRVVDLYMLDSVVTSPYPVTGPYHFGWYRYADPPYQYTCNTLAGKTSSSFASIGSYVGCGDMIYTRCRSGSVAVGPYSTETCGGDFTCVTAAMLDNNLDATGTLSYVKCGDHESEVWWRTYYETDSQTSTRSGSPSASTADGGGGGDDNEDSAASRIGGAREAMMAAATCVAFFAGIQLFMARLF